MLSSVISRSDFGRIYRLCTAFVLLIWVAPTSNHVSAAESSSDNIMIAMTPGPLEKPKKELPLSGPSGPAVVDSAPLPDSQSRGARLLRSFCTKCHELPRAALHNAYEWPSVVERMLRHIRSTRNEIRLPTVSERIAILGYLQSNAPASINDDSIALDTPGGRAYRDFCGQCHRLPEPRHHTAYEWPSVVQRMRKTMEVQSKKVPDDVAVREIIRFLQKHTDRR